VLYYVRGLIVFRAAGGGIELGAEGQHGPAALHGSWQIPCRRGRQGIMM
jgi:hypothetical protein